MSENKESAPEPRRNFLKGIAATIGAGTALGTSSVRANTPAATKVPLKVSAGTLAAERETPAELPKLTTESCGSDHMMDVLKTLDIDYIAANPGSTFRGLHESIINYGGNTKPELLTCLHEESSVAIAHGYAKVAGKPMAAMVQGTVGLQHASMAIYNAYADRVPMVILTGSIRDATERRFGIEWVHSAQDGAALVRDFTKWDDEPGSLQAFGESLVRGYRLTTSVPAAPILLVADCELQEAPLTLAERQKLSIPKLALPSPPQGASGAVREAARMLVAAENPLIIVDRYARSQSGVDLLVQLADLLNVPVVDWRARMNFPTLHPLNHTEGMGQVVKQADVILALEPVDLFGSLHRMKDQLHRSTSSRTTSGVKVISISSGEMLIKANYQDFQRLATPDLAIDGDAEATMPALIEEVQRQLSNQRKSSIAERGMKLAERSKDLLVRSRAEAANSWDVTPISVARLCMELYAHIKHEEYTLASDSVFQSYWPLRLWNMDKFHNHIGGSGAGGIGYNTPASFGAALANKSLGRITVSIVGDGDMMYAPGVLWTAAHHKIPLLTVVHNNRGYHQEIMHIQRIANRLNRGVERARIGSDIANPNIDFAKLAQSLGMHAEGPISDPAKLGPAIARAIETIKRGEPALLDVVSQPR